MIVVPLAAEHIDRFAGFTPEQRRAFPKAWIGNAHAYLDGDEVVAIYGSVHYGDTAWVSAFITDGLRQHKFFLHRAAKRGIEIAWREGVRKLVAEADDDRSERWLRRLGFQKQGGQWVCLPQR